MPSFWPKGCGSPPSSAGWMWPGRARCRTRQRCLFARAMAIRVQTAEQPRHLLGFCRRRGAGGGVSAQIQHADRRVGGIRLSHGQSLCAEPRQRRGRGAAGGKQLVADRVSRQRRHRAEDFGERHPPEDMAPYLQSQQALLDILPVLGFPASKRWRARRITTPLNSASSTSRCWRGSTLATGRLGGDRSATTRASRRSRTPSWLTAR